MDNRQTGYLLGITVSVHKSGQRNSCHLSVSYNLELASTFFRKFVDRCVRLVTVLVTIGHLDWAGIAELIWRLATGCPFRGSNPGVGDICRTLPNWP